MGQSGHWVSVPPTAAMNRSAALGQGRGQNDRSLLQPIATHELFRYLYLVSVGWPALLLLQKFTLHERAQVQSSKPQQDELPLPVVRGLTPQALSGAGFEGTFQKLLGHVSC
jgi:hypothetical protein